MLQYIDHQTTGPRVRSRTRTVARQIWRFGVAQAMSCIFPVAVFATLAVSKVVRVPGVPRYDVILVVLVVVQVAMVWLRLETVDELKTIVLFHAVGLGLEIFKVHMGSWAYPEPGYVKIADVPLYSGFMYASVGSYVVQAWKRFDLTTVRWPRRWVTFVVCAALYLNFFTEHFVVDLRYPVMAVVVVVFWRARFQFALLDRTRRIPAVVAFALIGLFIWVAENVTSSLGAYQYPYQRQSWHMVDLGKITSWLLLVIIVVVLVANLKNIKAERQDRTLATGHASGHEERSSGRVSRAGRRALASGSLGTRYGTGRCGARRSGR